MDEGNLEQFVIPESLNNLHPEAAKCRFSIKNTSEEGSNAFSSLYTNPEVSRRTIGKPFGHLNPYNLLSPIVSAVYENNAIGLLSDRNVVDSKFLIETSSHYFCTSHYLGNLAAKYLEVIQKYFNVDMYLIGSQGNEYGRYGFNIGKHDCDVQLVPTNLRPGITGPSIEDFIQEFGSNVQPLNSYSLVPNRPFLATPEEYRMIHLERLHTAASELRENSGPHFRYGSNVQLVIFHKKGSQTLNLCAQAHSQHKSYEVPLVQIGFPCSVDGMSIPAPFYDVTTSRAMVRGLDGSWYDLNVEVPVEYEFLANKLPQVAAVMAVRLVSKHGLNANYIPILNSIDVPNISTFLNSIEVTKTGNRESRVPTSKERYYRQSLAVNFFENALTKEDFDPALLRSPGFYRLVNNLFPCFADAAVESLNLLGVSDFSREEVFSLIADLWEEELDSELSETEFMLYLYNNFVKFLDVNGGRRKKITVYSLFNSLSANLASAKRSTIS